MYTLHDVRKTYRQGATTITALEGVTLEIPDGQLVAIQGPTGGGKSTLLQMLGALDRPTSGSVTLGGDDLSTAGDRRLAEVRATQVGFVFQGFNLIPTLSARENVETALEPLRVATAERRARATAALELVGLGERADHLPSQLSGGQRDKRVAACTSVTRPCAMCSRRSARRATAESCVTSTSVSPRSRHSPSRRAMISSRVSSSRLPVGSSARSTVGSFTSARAIATRCC
jgi:putative ABC transport system ATP-binding protein